MVQTFSAQCPDDPFGDGVDTDARSPLAKLAAVGCIPIAEQMAGFLAPGRRLDELPRQMLGNRFRDISTRIQQHLARGAPPYKHHR